MPRARAKRTDCRAVARAAMLAMASLSVPSAAHASEAAVEPISIVYAAKDSCPSEAAFVSSVRGYTTKWRPEDAPGAARRSFRVELGERGDAYAGKLVITMPSGKSSTREIAGPDCASVARALAVVVALAIDPELSGGAPREPDPQVPSEPAPEEPAPSPADVVASDDRPASPPPARDRRAPLPRTPARTRDGLRVAFAVEGRVEMTSAVTAGVLPVGAVAFEARAHLGSALPSWLVPSLAIGLRQSLPKRIQVGSGSSDLLWTAASLRLCPVRFVAFADRLEVAPCAEIDVGLLQAEAINLPEARSVSRPWFDRGAGLRAAYRLGASWAVGADFFATMPSTRDRFALPTGELISMAPSAGVVGAIHVELRL